MRTGNPVLNNEVFRVENATFGIEDTSANVMTLNGTVTKTAFLLGVLVFAGTFTWGMVKTDLDGAMQWAIVGAIGGFVLALVTSFKPAVSPYTSPIYAALEGLFLGAISAVFEVHYPGIVPQAVALTLGTLATMLMAYRSGLIKATENFKLGVTAATGGIMLLYLISFAMRMFTGTSIPFIHESGLVGIGFSIFVVVLASLNLVLDFDFIETGVNQGAPKYMEWYGAFGLLVTLVWLYIEILRLLAKLNSRD